MSPNDIEYFAWERKTFSGTTLPDFKTCKRLYAEHLITTKTKKQIWRMLCGPATGPCRCKCLCAPGIAWNALLAKQEQEATQCLQSTN